MTRTMAVVGTPAYMAPEQARGRGKFAGPEVDVYALGVVLYECLTGRPPFRDDDPIALMRQVADATPAAPRSVVHGIPRDLDLICRKCLSKEARDRYATAADLADDLDRFGAGLPVAARPIPWPVRAARWVRRNPAPAALATLLALLVTLGPAAVVRERGDARTREEARLRAEEEHQRLEEARAAAVKLAAARELVAIHGVVRRREADRPVGWTWANRADLRRAAGLAAGDPQALALLRTEATTALLAADLRPADPVAGGFTAGSAAASPDGTLVALGMLNVTGGGLLGALARIEVVLADPVSGRRVHTFSFPAAMVLRDGKPVPDRVVSLAFSPDGKRLFVGTRSERVVRLDVAGKGTAVKDWPAPALPGHLAVTADGAEVLGVCGESVVRWDAGTGAVKARVAAPGCWGLAVEPGTGAVVAALPDGLSRGAPVPVSFPTPPETPAARGVRHPAVLPGGRLIAAARGAAVELWDPVALRPVARLIDPDLIDQAAHADSVTAVVPHPSGAYLATASADRAVKVWAVASGRRVAAVQLPGNGPAALAWSGDGRYLLATGPSQTARFEFSPPAAERFAGFHAHPLAAAVPAGGGRVVALGEPAPLPAPVQLLYRTDPAGRVDRETHLGRRHEGTWPGLAVHPTTGAVLVTSTGTGVGRWNPDGAGPTDPLTLQVCRCPAYSPDGAEAWAVASAKSVRAWDAATGVGLPPGWVNDAGEWLTGTGSLNALAVGPGVAVAGGADGGIHLLGPGAAYVKTFSAERDPVQAVALTAAGDAVAGGTQTGKLRLVRLADRVELTAVADAHPSGVTAVSFSPDGSLLVTGGKDRVVRFWRRTADGGYEPAAAVTGLPAPVRALAFERDRPVLVLLLAGERAARVWDADRLSGDLGEMGLGW